MAISPEGIFSFCSYRSVDEYSQFWATGSGREYALGAMKAIFDSSHSAEEVAISGIEAACEFDDGSALPVQVQGTKLIERAP